MPDDRNVLFLTPEIVPFCKTGGLADVGGALPVELANLGLNVKVVCPFYREVREYFDRVRKSPQVALSERSLWLGGRLQKYRVLKSLIPKSRVEVFFIDFPPLFDRDGLYVENGKDYWDNFFRFAFFARASLEFAKITGFACDVVHANDWQSALALVYIRTTYAGDPVLGGARTVLTIHNLAYQGIFDRAFMESGDLSKSLFHMDALEFWNRINLLKGGIAFSDAVTTVSPTYAKEIQTLDYGYGLDGILRVHSGKLTGILNGIDYSAWNPELDDFIPYHYSVEDMRGKPRCKRELQRTMGLAESDDAMLIGMITRLVDQKGVDLVESVFSEIMKMDCQFVLLGTGMPEYHRFFSEMAIKHAGKFACQLAFDESLSHLIEAGSDAFLMPSLYEPCGLNQMYSLRYGAIPIVRATGGLRDTVSPATRSSIEAGSGTGFRFNKYSSNAMLKAVKSAVRMYYNEPETWRKLVVNAMSKDYSWGASAAKYARLYRDIAKLGGALPSAPSM